MSTDVKEFTGASGLLFVGDPHISSRKPGRRKDKDYTQRILGKLDQAVRIANEENYAMVILGDLFDRPVEEREAVKAQTMRILRKARHRITYLLGNHERTHEQMSDEDSISLLETAGIFDIISKSGPHAIFDFDGVKFGLGGTPYGEEIPTEVGEALASCKMNVWITHHDLEFEGAYPGSLPTHEIKGCKLAVNGHMHLTKKAKKEGMTTWFNPGNITRQAVDAIDHKPRVWGLDSSGNMKPYDLVVDADVFDLTGRLIDRIDLEEGSEKSAEEAMESIFVKLIEVSESGDMDESDDGSIILELIEDKISAMDAKENVRNQVRTYVTSLLSEVADA